MRFLPSFMTLTLLFGSACAVHSVSPAPMSVAPLSPTPVATASVARAAVTSSAAMALAAETATRAAATAEIPTSELEEGEDEGEEVAEESEPREGAELAPGAGLRYTFDISEEDLARLWKSEPEKLGSISVGFADEGRLINGQQFPRGDGQAWTVVTPNKAWATTETIDYLVAAIERVKRLHPTAFPLRVNQISAREGGYLRPHRSHQNGRDVDLGFYYPTLTQNMARAREKVIDVELNWELLKSLVLLADVQVILVDKRVQKVLYDFALATGEDKAWLDSLFHAGKASIVQHARRHRDHFHVRFFNPRAQELGRRIVPLLAERPEQNIAMVRVRSGDTLGAIARKHGSSVAAIQKANRMRGSFLRIAQVLKVPLRGPCTHCPLPPIVDVPPRRLPPELPASAAALGGPANAAPAVE